MRQVSTTRMARVNTKRNGQLTMGLDLGDRFCYFCVLNESGEIAREDRVATNKEAISKAFAKFKPCRIAMETGTHSPWISRLLAAMDFEVIVANAKNVRLIGENRKKDDRIDAQTLARLVRADPQLLSPVQHRGAEAQEDLSLIRARASLVRSRTLLINAARGLVKVTGDRLRRCTAASVSPALASELNPKMEKALLPLLHAVEVLNQQIRMYDQQIEELAQTSYPDVALLKQVDSVGTLTALTYILTLDYPLRFPKSRDAGCYVGLQPGRRSSGQSEPQMHITREGDAYLRTLLVQAAHLTLGRFGKDSDLRRWGLKLAARGGKSGKKRAVVAVARKLAVLLHHLWVSADAYEPFFNTCKKAA